MNEGDNYRRARLKIACPGGQVKTASPNPFANLRIVCVQQPSYVSLLFTWFTLGFGMIQSKVGCVAQIAKIKYI